jgi:hypothetical protein
MAVKLGNGNWAVKEDKLLAYNDNSGLFFNKEFDFSRGTSATYVAKDGLIKTAGIQPNIVNNGDFSELGSELVTNGDFATDSDWSKDSGWTIANGKASQDGTGTGNDGDIIQNSILDTSKIYKIVLDVVDYTQGTLYIDTSNIDLNVNGVGTYTLYFTPSSTNLFIRTRFSGFIGSIDNVSVKQVDPNDYWTLGTGTTISENKVNFSNATGVSLYQDIGTQTGIVKVTFSVTDYTSGTLNVYSGGNQSISNVNVTANAVGSYFAFVDRSGGNVNIIFGSSDNFTGSIDNVTVQEIQTDTPRIDFTNDTKGHLLLEPIRTNLFVYSQAFSTWQKINNIVVTDNFTTSPDGTQNSSKLTFDGTTNGRVEKPVPTTIGNQYTFSVWLKNDNLADPTQVWIGNSQFVQGEYVTITNEWQRFTTTQTADGTTEYPRVNVNQVGSIFAWGAQFEEGYPTSYIPTTGATSTRNADVCNNSGSAQDFNSGEGVLYAEIASLTSDVSSDNRIVLAKSGDTNNVIRLYYNTTTNTIEYKIRVASSNVCDLTYDLGDSTEFHKICGKWKQNDFALWVDGVEVATDTGGAVFPANTLNTLNFSNANASGDFFYGKVRNVQVFTEALTDEQLEKLTS